MHDTYYLGQRWSTYILLLALPLQSCHNHIAAPTSPEKDKLPPTLSFIATNQEEKVVSGTLPDNSANNQLTLQGQEQEGEGMKRENSQQVEESSIQGKNEQNLDIDIFDLLPPEMWAHILSYIPAGEIGKARQVNLDFYQLTTGYDKPGLVGVSNKPTCTINVDRWTVNQPIDFSEERFKELTTANIPSLFFYQFLKKVKYLPPTFWPYLPYTHTQELVLKFKHIDTAGVEDNVTDLAKHLQGTNIQMLNVSFSKLGASGITALAKHLQRTKIQILNVSFNQMGSLGVTALAKHLQGTKVQILNVSFNQISDSEVIELAQYLQHTQVKKVILYWNPISDDIKVRLRKQYPHITWGF